MRLPQNRDHEDKQGQENHRLSHEIEDLVQVLREHV